MKVHYLHDWEVTPEEAKEIQQKLAKHVVKENKIDVVHTVAGVDMSAPDPRGVARAAIVVLSYPELALLESQVIEEEVKFPYVPGLLSFRESPLILAASEKLSLTPDLILVDGQGLAHPRRLGLASHLGLIWDKPVIGCAKSRLCGYHQPVGPEVGDYAQLIENGEVIGAVLRTKKDSSPLYISIGHKVDLESALKWTLNCCRGYRLPEPTRLAHLAAGGRLKTQKSGERGYQARFEFL